MACLQRLYLPGCAQHIIREKRGQIYFDLFLEAKPAKPGQQNRDRFILK
jgi:hypothetical protein